MPRTDLKDPLNSTTEIEFDRDLQRLVPKLPTVAPGVTLRSRVMNHLPERTDRASAHPLDRKRRLVIAMALVTVAAMVGIFAGPRLFFGGTASIAASDVRQALQKVNSWHLTGWKLLNGKQARWEIWGRRSPFFYREQLGENVTFDDGRTRVRLLDADLKAGRKRPVALKMFSEFIPENQTNYNGNTPMPHSEATAISPESFLDESHHEGGTWVLDHEKGDITTLRRNTGTGLGTNIEEYENWMEIDKRTRLPHTMEWIVDRKISPNIPKGAFVAPAKRYTSGHLDATFDAPLVEEMTQMPDSAVVLDLTAPPDNRVPKTNAVTKNGLTIAATSVKRDKDGNIHIVYSAWLGNEPLDSEKTGLGFGPMVSPIPTYRRDRKGVMVRNEENLLANRGLAYMEISRPPRALNVEHFDCYYAPVMPIGKNSPAPDTLTLNLRVSLNATEIDPETYAGKWNQIMGEDMALTIALPKTMEDLGYDRITPDDCLAPGSPRWPLKLEIAQARADYYEIKVATTPVRIEAGPGGKRVMHYQPVDPPDAEARAMRFYNETITEARRTKNKMAESMARQNIRSLQEVLERRRQTETAPGASGELLR